jgi:predicted transcriptional regulator
MTKNLFIHRILFTIKKNLSIENLLEIGLDYSQIANIINELIEQRLIRNIENEGLVLTDKGNEFLEKFGDKILNNSSSEWILPTDKYRTEKIKSTDVYLPKKKG